MTNSSAINGHFKRLVKQAKLGSLFYRCYYAPKAFVQKGLRQGVINVAIDQYARNQMEQAAYQLTPIDRSSTQTPLEIHFLSGEQFWYQTCFCAYSMAQQCDRPLRPVIYDDGSLKQRYQDAIRTVFPNAIIHTASEIEARIDQYLPEHRFPVLRERRLNYPNLRKLTDVHLGSQGWKLVLDSDMLFFRRPQILLDWLEHPQQPCHMVDVETCYGYSRSLMVSLTETAIAERLNVGICGLNSTDLDWEQVEFWCKTLIEQQGTHYYQEQALIAMLLAGRSCAIAPAEEYIVLPTLAEVRQPRAVLHHYVADAKPHYFRYGWKHILKSSL